MEEPPTVLLTDQKEPGLGWVLELRTINCLKSLLCMWAYPVHCSHCSIFHTHLWKLNMSLDTVKRHWETDSWRLRINGQTSRAAPSPTAVSNDTREPWLPVQALELTFTRAYSRRSSMEPLLHSSVWMTFFPPLPWVWMKIKIKSEYKWYIVNYLQEEKRKVPFPCFKFPDPQGVQHECWKRTKKTFKI